MPNFYVAASVAKAMGRQAAYIRNRGLDKTHYKGLVLEYLRRYQEAIPLQLEELLMDKLSDLPDADQKYNKVRNLFQEMVRKDVIVMIGGRGSNARWVLKM